jgi:hypothetical protein
MSRAAGIKRAAESLPSIALGHPLIVGPGHCPAGRNPFRYPQFTPIPRSYWLAGPPEPRLAA